MGSGRRVGLGYRQGQTRASIVHRTPARHGLETVERRKVAAGQKNSCESVSRGNTMHKMTDMNKAAAFQSTTAEWNIHVEATKLPACRHHLHQLIKLNTFTAFDTFRYHCHDIISSNIRMSCGLRFLSQLHPIKN